MEQTWYVNAAHAPVVWATAVVVSVATLTIYKITRTTETTTPSVLRRLYARRRPPVTAAQVAAAVDGTTPGPVASLPVPVVAPRVSGSGGTGGVPSSTIKEIGLSSSREAIPVGSSVPSVWIVSAGWPPPLW